MRVCVCACVCVYARVRVRVGPLSPGSLAGQHLHARQHHRELGLGRVHGQEADLAGDGRAWGRKGGDDA
jgi:hypothetical protein